MYEYLYTAYAENKYVLPFVFYIDPKVPED